MNFEISLLPALGGYWLLTHLIPTRTEALRQSGYHIAFRSAVVGLLLFVLAYLILHLHFMPTVRRTRPGCFEITPMTFASSFRGRKSCPLASSIQYSPRNSKNPPTDQPAMV